MTLLPWHAYWTIKLGETISTQKFAFFTGYEVLQTSQRKYFHSIQNQLRKK